MPGVMAVSCHLLWLALVVQAAVARGVSGGPGRLAACQKMSAEIPQLRSYAGVKIPGTYWLDMICEEDAWRPADAIGMPLHHASRLELSGLASFPALTAHRHERVRFTIELTSREIFKVPDRSQWRATYHARVVGLCLPSGP
jgi:hypothetical protein